MLQILTFIKLLNIWSQKCHKIVEFQLRCQKSRPPVLLLLSKTDLKDALKSQKLNSLTR